MSVNPNSAPPAQYNITNILGVDVASNPTTPGSAATGTSLFYPEDNNPQFSPGTIVLAGGGSQYIFCQVGTVGSINTGDFVAFTQSIASTFSVQQLGTAQAALGCRVGVYQGSAIGYGNGASLPASVPSVNVQWCWIALSGSNLVGNIVSTTANNSVLWVSTTLGYATSASASGVYITNATNVASTGNAGNTAIVANQMMIFQGGSATTNFGPF